MAETLSDSQTTSHHCAINIDRFKNYNSLDYESYINSGVVYEDDVFTEGESVYWHDFTHANPDDQYRMSDSDRWLSAYAQYPDSKIYTVGSNMVEAIDQGGLGDCYFLAGLSAVGEWSDVYHDHILTDNRNAAHIFAVDVYIRGILTTVFTDDMLWFNSAGTVLKASQIPANGDLFVPFMEKIFAKIHGNYERLEGGNAYETFNLLLGSPNLYIFWYEDEIGYDSEDDAGTFDSAKANVLALLRDADEKKWIGGCSWQCPNVMGLVCGHQYSIIQIINVNSAGTDYDFVQVRNPWNREV